MECPYKPLCPVQACSATKSLLLRVFSPKFAVFRKHMIARPEKLVILSQFYTPRILFSSCNIPRSWAYTVMTESSLEPLPSIKHTFTGLLLCAKHCAKLLGAPDSNLFHLHKNILFLVPSSMFHYISFYTITLTFHPNLNPSAICHQHINITPFTFKK